MGELPNDSSEGHQLKGGPSPTEGSEGATIVEESLVLLDFPEFQATSLFDEAKFRKLAEDQSSTTFSIDGCSFDSVKLAGLGTEAPSCLIDGKIPLQGKKLDAGVTYFLFDYEEGKGSERGSQEASIGSHRHTCEYIQFASRT